MSKPLRLTLIVLGALALMAVLGGATAFVLGGRTLVATMELPEETVVVRGGSAAFARGEHLVSIWGCTECHAASLGGQILIDDKAFAYLPASNLTGGHGGLPVDYRVTQFEQAVRHGIGIDGRLLMVMPSFDYNTMTDEDLAALFTYLRGQPPIDNTMSARQLRPAGRLAALFVGDELFTARAIPHERPHRSHVERGVTPEYGGYLMGMCVGCHGTAYTGIKGLGPNLTLDTATGLGGWSREDFRRVFREGRRPDGSPVDSAMPWYVMTDLTDDETGAMWAFLQTLPATPGVIRQRD